MVWSSMVRLLALPIAFVIVVLGVSGAPVQGEDPAEAAALETYRLTLSATEGAPAVELVVVVHASYGPPSGEASDLTLHRHEVWINPVPGAPRAGVPAYAPWQMRACIDLGGPPEEFCLRPVYEATTVQAQVLTDRADETARFVGGPGCIKTYDDQGRVRSEHRLPALVVPLDAAFTPGGGCAAFS